MLMMVVSSKGFKLKGRSKGLEVIEDGGEGIDGFPLGVGGPKAVVSLVDGGDWAVCGGVWERKTRSRVRMAMVVAGDGDGRICS
ncbi:hypothetical protein L6452_18523 [Arctium lappa]|uniref:Uncharacterized protein n=1 Tax=Arctium lappa TaxID=4217 RepID=A0ACB9C6Q1_ARCLA|nr:hypothetical protein L6452_18523 [Arctium lappa]